MEINIHGKPHTHARKAWSCLCRSTGRGLIVEVIYDAYHDLVRADDFNELKGIVKELAHAQQRTEQRVEDLAEAQQHLAEAQQRTEQRVERT